ncbi:hypothetical protein HN587_07080 [Candidatus Woesearchaeota archaeon]|jgi:hypothetical protein|nr:hypothetical protein [Candidatus Woesearchaeota archaeon]
MNAAFKSTLIFLLNKHYIGGKHFPENKLIISRTKWLTKQEQKEFNKEYKQIRYCLIILKKKTGKGIDWHISLNPSKLQEIKKLLEI